MRGFWNFRSQIFGLFQEEVHLQVRTGQEVAAGAVASQLPAKILSAFQAMDTPRTTVARECYGLPGTDFSALLLCPAKPEFPVEPAHLQSYLFLHLEDGQSPAALTCAVAAAKRQFSESSMA
ncbi:hypothetical protein NE237_030780 [Protea cynaroides]|uniref:Uncharacterized protein n=1 Tax=Protea cynaroides TaxID=273540 RepID=A0A9Q0GWL0_9MAGN|nr:hypothetical protein NE237_030780 [Protea cynaroides]